MLIFWHQPLRVAYRQAVVHVFVSDTAADFIWLGRFCPRRNRIFLFTKERSIFREEFSFLASPLT